MAEILVLNSIKDEIMNSENEYILFAKKEWVTLGDTTYDFVFHNIPGVERLGLEPKGDICPIPFLKYQYPGERQEAQKEIYSLSQQYPHLRTFGLRTDLPQLHKTLERELEVSEGLKFFDANRTDYGLEIIGRDFYSAIGEDELIKKFDWDKINTGFLDKIRENLNSDYAESL